MADKIDIDTLAHFHKRGYVVLRRVFPASWVSMDLGRLLDGSEDPSKFMVRNYKDRSAMTLEGHLEYLQLAGRCLGAIRDLLGGIFDERARVIDVSMITALPGAKAQVLHRDGIFDARKESINLIIPLTDFTPTNGSTEFIPGSHRFSVDRPTARFLRWSSIQNNWEETTSAAWMRRTLSIWFFYLRNYPSRRRRVSLLLRYVRTLTRRFYLSFRYLLLAASGRAGKVPEPPMEKFTAPVGDILIYKRDLLHRGGRNTSDAPRHALSILVESDDIQRPFATSKHWQFEFSKPVQYCLTAVLRDFGTIDAFIDQAGPLAPPHANVQQGRVEEVSSAS
jgi:hypothetical protein